jgi:hypothetical protein
MTESDLHKRNLIFFVAFCMLGISIWNYREETHTDHHFDERWSEAFRQNEVYRQRYAYILKYWSTFSPTASKKTTKNALSQSSNSEPVRE